ncbi:MAG: hypothetical protein KGZ84_07540, partial [Erysipelotrichia bacterium]|nr:hypothetical protein [Erysipelotrichia bacterium]
KKHNEFESTLSIESSADDMLIIRPNEYLTLIAADANEMQDLNGSGIHWHMETEEMAGFIIAILKGNSIIIEIRSIFVKVIDIPSRYKILSKEKYEKIKHHYIGKKRVRIYSGNLIIQRAD